jgi:hypothetical protein
MIICLASYLHGYVTDVYESDSLIIALGNVHSETSNI